MVPSLLALFIKNAMSDYVVLSVLLLLLFMSVVSWALFFSKLLQVSSVARRSERFYVMVENGAPLKNILAKREASEDVPFNVLLRFASEGPITDKAVDSAYLIAQGRLERGLGGLATIGSTAPFVGLFGTVWGIMKAFHMIGLRGSANLAVVAPGISEALVNTALGLFVAIPAVFFYNLLMGRVERLLNRFKAYGSLFVERYGGENGP